MSEPDPTTRALFEAAVEQALSAEVDDEAYWNAVYALQAVPMDAAWPLVQEAATSEKLALRALAADVLRCVARREPTLVEATMWLLAARRRVEKDTQVLVAILGAFGELAQPRRVELVLPFLDSGDADARLAAVHELSGARSPDAIAAFVRASRDESDDVRNWATLELGSQLGDDEEPARDDLPDVVDALLARLDDAHGDTRGEAIAGLARRGDRRVLPALLGGIAAGASSLELEAATALGAPELCEPLRAMLAAGDEEDVALWESKGVREAIAACCAAIH